MMMDLMLILCLGPAATEGEVPAKFGASDVQDLNWVQLNAYTCTECGRCTRHVLQIKLVKARLVKS
jgi:hypothetical protein